MPEPHASGAPAARTSPIPKPSASAQALELLADQQDDPERAQQLRDDAYTARAYLRQRDRDVLRLRRLLCEQSRLTA